MIIRRNTRKNGQPLVTLLAHGQPQLAWTAHGRAYFQLPRAQRRGGVDVEISVDIDELERMVQDAKKGSPFTGTVRPPR